MLTLHKTTETIKKILKWGGISLGALLLLILLVRGGSALFKLIFPDKPPAPTVAYGQLPPILFPDSISDKEFEYTLETVTGNLPVFQTDRLYVHTIVPAEPNLLNLEDARESVAKVNFTVGENSITDTVYQWTSREKADKKIIQNIVSKDFTVSSNFFSYPEVLTASNLPTEEQAKLTAKTFLTSMNLFPPDIDEEKTTTQLLAIQNATIFPATSLSTAQLIRVDFFQKAVNELPILYPKPPFSTIHFFIGGGENSGQVVQGQFYHQTISEESATYPIKTAQQAFEELKQGKGYIAAYYGSKNTITINDVYLAYYMGEEKQQYLMPIIVFEGKEGFFAYVPAVLDEWITGSPQPTSVE